MSDDFDKDTNSLPGDDDQFDDKFDWELDDDEDSAEQAFGERTGVTGQLDWRRNFEDVLDDLPPMDDADGSLDWQQATDIESGAKPSGMGLTGALDWQQDTGDADDADTPADDASDLPPWMQEQAARDFAEMDNAAVEANLDWMQDADDSEPAAAQPDEEETPDWLRDVTESTPATPQKPTMDASIPDWLRDASDDLSSDEDELADATPSPIQSPSGEAVPDWLKGHDAFDDSPRFAEEPEADADAMPSWLADVQAGAGAGQAAEEPEVTDVSDPLAALDSLRQPDFDDADEGVSDFLSEFDDAGAFDDSEPDMETAGYSADDLDFDQEDFLTEEAEPGFAADFATDLIDETPEPQPGFDDMDFESMFADTGETAADALPDFGDLLGDDDLGLPMGAGDELPGDMDLDADLEDIFGDLDMPGIEAAVPGEAAALPDFEPGDEAFDDLFGDELGEEVGTPEIPAQGTDFEPGDEAFDDLFGELPDEEVDEFAADEFGAYDEEFDAVLDTASQMDTGYLRGLGLTEDQQAEKAKEEDLDWFAESDTGTDMDWLDELGDLDTLPAAEAPTDEDALEPADADFLADLLPEGLEVPTGEPSAEADVSDIELENFLSTFEDSEELQLPSTDELSLATSAEFEDLFAGSQFDHLPDEAEAETGIDRSSLAPDAPDWLTELQVSEESASSLLRKRKERPLDELPESLQGLHERGQQLTFPTVDETSQSDILSEFLPGVDALLPPLEMEIPQKEVSGAAQLSAEQQKRMLALRELVGIDREIKIPGVGAEGEEFDLLEDGTRPEAEAAKAAAPAKRRRRRARIKVDRVLIGLLLVVGVALPFFLRGFAIGTLPPNRFDRSSIQQAAFDQVDALMPGELVLVGVEYGPTGAAELDTATNALLHHILLRQAQPVLIGSNAVGMLHANNILQAIGTGDDAIFLQQTGRATPFQANTDYYVIRYLTGNVVGLRTLAEDMAGLVATDIHGNPTGLSADLRDFSLIVIVSENAEGLRGWAEQVVPLTRVPLVVVSSYSAAPLSAPYVEAGLSDGRGGGLLTGYRDAYTYHNMVNVLAYGELPTPTPTPTTVAPTITPTSVPTEVPDTAVPEGVATEPDGAAPVTTVTGVTGLPSTFTATATTSPTPTATFTATPSATPTATATFTSTPTATPTPLPVAVVNAAQAVNVREGAGTDYAPVTVVEPGARVLILEQNADGTWVNVRLEDGSEGWIFAQLLDIQPPEAPAAGEATPTPETFGAVYRPPRLLNRQVPYLNAEKNTRSGPYVLQAPTATPSAWTVEAVETTVSEEAVPEVTAEAVVIDRPEIPYKDERWYAMTLGIMISVIVITAGSLFNILRSLFRRDRS